MYRQALQPYSFTDTVCMVVKKLEMFLSFNFQLVYSNDDDVSNIPFHIKWI